MTVSDDERYYAAQRQQMVEHQLARRGIRSEAVLCVMGTVPREQFVLETNRSRAYEDAAQPIDCQQTISQPYMVARMTELLGDLAGQSVLEIGTGTGYQTAVLASLAARVYTIEWHPRLMNQACDRLAALGLHNAAFRCGDGSVGWPEYAPFTGILVTAGAPDVPQPLCDQLTIGGRLVVPTGPEGDQTLVVVHRTAQGWQRTNVLKCRFVKLLGRAGWPG
jgi:protein-L-isoaspartate(D-aspartate) O-methyltransferase